MTTEELHRIVTSPVKDDGYEIHLAYLWKKNDAKSIFYITGLDVSELLNTRHSEPDEPISATERERMIVNWMYECARIGLTIEEAINSDGYKSIPPAMPSREMAEKEAKIWAEHAPFMSDFPHDTESEYHGAMAMFDWITKEREEIAMTKTDQEILFATLGWANPNKQIIENLPIGVSKYKVLEAMQAAREDERRKIKKIVESLTTSTMVHGSVREVIYGEGLKELLNKL